MLDKRKACEAYEMILDLTEENRCSPDYSKWCDLESRLAKLIGPDILKEYFRIK